MHLRNFAVCMNVGCRFYLFMTFKVCLMKWSRSKASWVRRFAPSGEVVGEMELEQIK